MFAAVFAFFETVYPRRYTQLIERYSAERGLDASLVCGIVWAESKFSPAAQSEKGACGLMQLMPETARMCADAEGMAYKPESLFEPEYNIALGTYYLAYLTEKFDERLAVAAYNAGEGNVVKWQEMGLDESEYPFAETRNYVGRVYRAKRIYAAKGF